MLWLKLLFESIRFSLSALLVHPLRSLLSLLGVTVGIFAIVAVFTAVDSLETSIRKSMAFLGNNIMYVQKWPWSFKPGYPWWKYMNRPVISEREFQFLLEHATTAESLALTADAGGQTAKYQGRAVENVNLRGTTYGLNKVSDVPIAEGRYFAQSEVNSGSPVAIIGHTVAHDLFGQESAIGRVFRLGKASYKVIGVLQEKGKSSIMNTPTPDDNVIIPYLTFKKYYKIGKWAIEPSIIAKGYPNDPHLDNLEGELRVLMRSYRSQRPVQEDSFALNRSESAQEAVSSIFVVLSLAGGIIGGFSILVGAFGIANIMFVSVRERINQIGIQKSLGATAAFILAQFLFEAIFLAIAGGILGIGLVFLLTLIPQDALPFEMTLKNIVTGITISSITGLLAGLIPAWVASRLDPVEAIRAK